MNQLITFAGIVCLLMVSIRSSFAQNPAIVPAITPATVDSTRQSLPAADRPGSPASRGPALRRGVGAAVVDSANEPSLVVDDTTQISSRQQAAIRKIIPRQATLRSLMLPGLGQAYNGQYYKIPFIYGGFGAIGYFFVRYRRLSREAETGYRRLLYGDPVPNDTVMVPVTEVLINNSVFRRPTQAKAAYDFYRRYRDLNVILSIVVYAVNAVEANVAAHLKTFDLSDDISMRVEPTVLPMPGTGLVPGIRVALTFK